MLNPRLSFAFNLYDNCNLAADIGTDHAYLPAALISKEKCRRMILTDISESALNNARKVIAKMQLNDRVLFRLGNGLLPLTEKCDMVSIMGMGGKTISSILQDGYSHLSGASLLLSAHTDIDLVRASISSIDYRIISEDPCFDSGRFYLFIKAVPGKEQLNEQQIRLGIKLSESNSPFLRSYLIRRREVLNSKLVGLISAERKNQPAIIQTQMDMNFYDSILEEKQ